uniref:Uncharacterized protein n=1 Tax=Mantoniella antarctica TaxID=81844 RepID=A0A7S0X476_9CHLO|mmetsp:Transcript_16453/g.40505  ORF Transcript_16453/g.40505 Transcript_16453/m.40505 type:complete len:175 (+) Transcript_16453:162-686(+)
MPSSSDSDSGDSDASEDAEAGGGKHRKRKRQKYWRWASIAGFALLVFVFYEEILDAAVEVKNIKRVWLADLREGATSPRRALDQPLLGKEKELADASTPFVSQAPTPPDLKGVVDAYRGSLDRTQLTAHLHQAEAATVKEAMLHSHTKEQLLMARHRIADLEEGTRARAVPPPA